MAGAPQIIFQTALSGAGGASSHPAADLGAVGRVDAGPDVVGGGAGGAAVGGQDGFLADTPVTRGRGGVVSDETPVEAVPNSQWARSRTATAR
jgi:hypothetical protein